MSAVEFECKCSWLNAMLQYQRVTDPFSNEWFYRRHALIWLIALLPE